MKRVVCRPQSILAFGRALLWGRGLARVVPLLPALVDILSRTVYFV
ncbi:hypothetical protein D8I24_7827 [Cupriavidus necator H850]|nr:hypothetical protein D8I24_7827 [Cupriavidus necator H850]